ncbi:MAG: hypothetical protein HY533_03490, partial [Chloroflexi bacterium]|nr:hypothetical protein [Chloroflexota bacterium]
LLNMVIAAQVASGALGVRLADFARLARRIGAGLKVKDLMESALAKLR